MFKDPFIINFRQSILMFSYNDAGIVNIEQKYISENPLGYIFAGNIKSIVARAEDREHFNPPIFQFFFTKFTRV